MSQDQGATPNDQGARPKAGIKSVAWQQCRSSTVGHSLDFGSWALVIRLKRLAL